MKKNYVVSLFLIILFLIIFIFNSIKNNYNYNYIIEKNNVNYSFVEVISDGNISNCENLQDKRFIESCKFKLINCSDDDCYFKKARYELNSRLCFNIVDENKRIACTSLIKISKIKYLAVSKNNISICNDFDEIENVNNCKDNFYFTSRYNYNNLSYCNYIQNEVMKNECEK